MTAIRVPALGWQMALAFVLSLLFLAGLIGWLQNVHMITANGMYKSIQAEPWIADFAHARLDQSNYLYFPLYGASAWLLDALGILRGVAWKQFAYLNAFWASLGVAAVYGFVHRLTGEAKIAAPAALFHLGCGFVLLLAVINEDIMPGYTLVLASMLLAGLWFARPTVARVVGVGVIFTLGWLVEWRLIFPTLPALLLALAIAPAPVLRRAAMMVLLLASILAVVIATQLLWHGHNGSAGVHNLLWTGKGVDSGWAGLTWGKLWTMLSGIGGYLLTFGAHNDPVTSRQAALPLALSVVLQVAIFAACVVAVWPRRGEARLRAIAAVFLGTLGAGQVMNLYSQPHDPQMQVNVMAWLTVAWALLLAATAARRPAVFGVLAVLSLAPLLLNVAFFSRWRGGDAEATAALATIEQRFPPDSTVFVYWGFEPITMWQYAMWSRTWDWDGTPGEAKFKWIAVDAGAIRHAGWTPEQHAESIRRDLDAAFARGYRVVISDVWTWSVAELAAQLSGLSAANRAPAIHAMLHDTYDATPVLDVPTVGTYYELRPKRAR
ncbi:hypothetical protein [Reyranella sp.]|uniref:hypothetical protein n=1 Tax=Reyranella sp. TaxID=1929291 RepID=UPI003D0B13E7